MTNKFYYYIGVQTEKGMRLVTNINNATRTAEWNADDKPMEFSMGLATDITDGLLMNFNMAVVIKSRIKFDRQYFEVIEEEEK